MWLSLYRFVDVIAGRFTLSPNSWRDAASARQWEAGSVASERHDAYARLTVLVSLMGRTFLTLVADKGDQLIVGWLIWSSGPVPARGHDLSADATVSLYPLPMCMLARPSECQ